jgi:fimbrial isopeptide formation D2 family protein/LPXTG-motif cell wall-anchored protein
MHTMKKLISLVLALAMIMMVGAAFAATVTVTNPGEGKTYEYYKVFDVTYNADKSAKATSYTKTDDSDALYTALTGDDSPFALEATTSNLYNVSLKTGKTETDVRDWLSRHVDLLTKHTDDDFEDGFYLMTVKKGTEVQLATTFNVEGANVTIIDKNQTIPGPDKQEQVANGTWVYEGAFNSSATAPTASVGDNVNYKVVGTFTHYVGTEQVKKLTFTDVMSDGLTANRDVTVKINGSDPVKAAEVTYTVGDDGKTTTVITVPTMDGDTFLYNSENTYEITYSAKINEKSIVDGEEENTVDLKYTDENDHDHETTPDKTIVKDYKITLTKQDSAKATKLAGAKFRLYDAATAGHEIPVVLVTGEGKGDGTAAATANNVYRHAKDGETGVEMVVGTTGIIEIQGLANGSYYFDETEAPVGYNKLTSRTEATTITNADATITVNNAKGTELPSTGGIGTTIFYILGGLLIVGAAIILVARRKAQD